jgi:predicted RNA-binding protein with PUA-like domain
VCALAHPDETQFEKTDEHFDPKATKEKPIWGCVNITFLKKFEAPMTLLAIKQDPKLAGMLVREVGSRLSIQPVSTKHGEYILTITLPKRKSKRM